MRSGLTRGLIPVLATPFTDNGDLDTDGLRRLVDFQQWCGVDGVAVFGFASEGFTLTAADREQILRIVDRGLAPDQPLVAGINATAIRPAIEQAAACADAGASALMVIPPYQVKPTADQLVDFYGELAAAVGLPVMVQDAPGSTGVTMPVELLAKLSTLDGVTAVKIEPQPTVPKIAAVAAATADDFDVLGGQNALFALDEYQRGAVGSMPACEFADALAVVLRDSDRAGFDRLLPLIRFGLQPGLAWSIHKHALVQRGVLDSAAVRAPARDADAGTLAALAAILAELNLPRYPR
ncbi:dihydrodipicolinate synthase family protein [Actinocatenispora thailandica]|uniref:dihydrodipicolinate synthase family protein n=1 Tax=Actinocatenispora thailandica TaxID=227318 RepID=UPI001EF1E96D|nr:dihydrodipicolinate synthase family protein [Actinocatenispora thailandica]